MTFTAWRNKVAKIMYKLASVDPDDIEDWDYYTAWEYGVTPKDAAVEALENAGWVNPEDDD